MIIYLFFFEKLKNREKHVYVEKKVVGLSVKEKEHRVE